MNNDLQPKNSQAKNAFGLLGILCLTKRFFTIWLFSAFRVLPIIGQYYQFFYYIIIIALVVLAFPCFRYKFRASDLMFGTVFILCYILSYFNSSSIEYLNQGLTRCLVQAVPLFYVGLCFDIYDEVKIGWLKKRIYEWLYYISIFGIIVNSVYYLYRNALGTVMLEDSSASTNSLIPLCYVLFIAVKNKKPIAIIISIIGFFSMVVYGVRTNMIVPIAMLIILLLLEMKSGMSKIITISGITAISAAFIHDFELIVLGLETFFARFGVRSRFFYIFHSEGIGYLSNRENVWKRAIDHIVEKPFFGYGLFADRAFYSVENGYSHNLFLELFVNYGVVLGTILIVFLIITLYKGFVATRNEAFSRGLLLSLLCSEIVMLMAAGSYLVEGPFFFLIGYATCCYRFFRKRDI